LFEQQQNAQRTGWQNVSPSHRNIFSKRVRLQKSFDFAGIGPKILELLGGFWRLRDLIVRDDWVDF
jgi:hypothetical protein